MSFRTRSEATAKTVFEALGLSPSEDQGKAVIAAIEQALVETAAEANERCAGVAKDCCSADMDLAHKIAREIKQRHKALVANLSSLR